jgi:hypothetical protein
MAILAEVIAAVVLAVAGNSQTSKNLMVWMINEAG